MAKYVKIQPIEAEQFDGSKECAKRLGLESENELGFDDDSGRDHRYWISTLEGPLLVRPGAWVATGVNGEQWPIADDIFRVTYRPMAEADHE